MARWIVALTAAALAVAARADMEPFELTIVQYQHPATDGQEYYMSRVEQTLELAESRGQGNVLLLNTGGSVATGSDGSDATVSPAATALSLSDFDDGMKGLKARLKASGENFVAANMKSSQLSEHISKSSVKEIGGQKIGVIGYVSPYLNVLLDAEDATIVSEVAAIRDEVRRLKAAGVSIIIAMGNAGHESNMEVARRVPDVDAVVASPTEVATDAFPQMVTQPWKTRVPMLEIPTSESNMIGVTRLVFNEKGVLRRGVGTYRAVKSGVEDNLTEETVRILQLEPKQGGGMAELSEDHAEMGDKSVSPRVPAPAPVTTASHSGGVNRVLSSTDSLVSGRRADCVDSECAMGKIIADAIKWRLGSRINAAVVGSGAFEGVWDGLLRESDVTGVLNGDLTLYIGRLRGDQVEDLFEEAMREDAEFLHVSGAKFSAEPASHIVSSVRMECAACAPRRLMPVDGGLPYTLAFVTGSNAQPSVFSDVRDTGMNMRDDVLIPYLRRQDVLTVPRDTRILMGDADEEAPAAAEEASAAAEEASAAAEPARPALPMESPRPESSRPESSQPESSRPESSQSESARPVVHRPAASRPQSSRPHSSRPGSSRPAAHRPQSSRPGSSRPPRPTGSRPHSPRPALAQQQAAEAYQQAVMAAVQQATTGEQAQSYSPDQQLALGSVQHVTTVVEKPAAAAGAARPEADQTGLASLLPAWLTSSDEPAVATAEQPPQGGLSSLLPSWLTANSDPAAGGQVAMAVLGVPAAMLALSMAAGAVL
ncbi:snake venom 5'-nucleotidase-like [Pollicipes pollicipes]|uniref:snake venom 5'-nucleotidase-like n=1 Tax=Pollicipes pollicipes TaxID=41117 RepID=UPI001884D114|nr:snake venom 5'-nucleotidase-like [Pollicipes pollicipes]